MNGTYLYIVNKHLSSWALLGLKATLEKRPFENIVGKGENAGYQHFLFFPQCFLTIPKRISIFKLHFLCPLQMLSIWTGLKISHFGKELTLYQMTKF